MSSLTQTALTKYLAIGHFPKPPAPEERQAFMPNEGPVTRQLPLDRNGVVFLTTTFNAEEPASLLKSLPLGNAGLLVCDLIPVRPLTPLGAFIKNDHPQAPLQNEKEMK